MNDKPLWSNDRIEEAIMSVSQYITSRSTLMVDSQAVEDIAKAIRDEYETRSLSAVDVMVIRESLSFVGKQIAKNRHLDPDQADNNLAKIARTLANLELLEDVGEI